MLEDDTTFADLTAEALLLEEARDAVSGQEEDEDEAQEALTDGSSGTRSDACSCRGHPTRSQRVRQGDQSAYWRHA